MRVKVKIEQKHIDNGLRGALFDCPIALGVIDTELPGGKKPTGASIKWYMGSIVLGDRRAHFKMPVRAARFAKAFDNLGKHAVKPFSFFAVINDGDL